MARLTLSAEEDYSFHLLGISSHAKDYRLCWAVNSVLGIELEKQEMDSPLPGTTKKQLSLLEETPVAQTITIYTFYDQETYIDYTLINNYNPAGYMAPEQKSANFFLKITGDLADERKADLMLALKEIDLVLAVFDIDVKKLKSKQNFLF